MKTIRTILGTLAVTILGYGLLAAISVRSNSAFILRTLYQIFAQSYFVALVLGIAFLLIAIILTVALMSLRDDEREEREEKEDEFSLPSADSDDEPDNEAVRSEVGAFRKPVRPLHADPSILLDDDDDEEEDEEDVPVFMKKSVAPRSRIRDSAIMEEPSVESIFGEADEKPVKPAKPKQPRSIKEDKPVDAKTRARHCVFCNALIEDGSEFCPSCGKRL